jgi:hypothetical protein
MNPAWGWVIWAIPVLPTARYTYGRFRAAALEGHSDMWSRKFDTEESVMSALAAFGLGAIWFLWILWFAVGSHPHRYEPERKQIEERRQLAQRNKDYVKKAELEVGRHDPYR